MGDIQINNDITKDTSDGSFIKKPSSVSVSSNTIQLSGFGTDLSEVVVSIHDKKEDAHENRFSQVNTTLSGKVDKEDGKGLSQNDLNNELKQIYDDSAAKSHVHSNKTTIDGLISSGNGQNYLSDDGTYKTITLTNLANRDLNNITSNAKTSLNTAGIRTVVESYVSGTSWYRLWSDGWVEQGGYVYNDGNAKTIAFLKPFIDTNYFFTRTAGFKGDPTNERLTTGYIDGTKTTNTIQIYTSANNWSGYSIWEAKGF